MPIQFPLKDFILTRRLRLPYIVTSSKRLQDFELEYMYPISSTYPDVI